MHPARWLADVCGMLQSIKLLSASRVKKVGSGFCGAPKYISRPVQKSPMTQQDIGIPLALRLVLLCQ